LIDVKNTRSHGLSPLQNHRVFEQKPALGLDPGVVRFASRKRQSQNLQPFASDQNRKGFSQKSK
jgi:hypothetical protein